MLINYLLNNSFIILLTLREIAVRQLISANNGVSGHENLVIRVWGSAKYRVQDNGWPRPAARRHKNL